MDPEELSRALSALSALPLDDPVRLRVERVAESFVRDGRRRRQKEQRLRREAADRAVLAASATGGAARREDAALVVPVPGGAPAAAGALTADTRSGEAAAAGQATAQHAGTLAGGSAAAAHQAAAESALASGRATQYTDTRSGESTAGQAAAAQTAGTRAGESAVAGQAAVTSAQVIGRADQQAEISLVVPGISVQPADSVGTLLRPRRCYVCKQHFTEVSAFYHQLCPACAAENLAWRSARTPLDGRRALVTGGRVKIGFQVALMLLRDGAAVRVVTRFPYDAVRRFRAVEDSAKWLDRLTVTGLDLRDPRQVVELCDELLAAGEPLDVLINNAAQTVRRPESSYAPLIAADRRAAAELGGGLRELAPIAGYRGASAGSVPHSPELAVDENGLLPDPSPRNSWSAELGGLDAVELLEVHLVNAVAPALLADRLLPLMTGSPFPRRYIVNVTAVEGRFEVRNKTAGHPHTNMAKAALNMLTRTSAEALARRGVYLSSVDTGWITDEKPMPSKTRHAEAGFRTPLDIVDGAARIYHPIVSGENGEPLYGVFLKDYRAVAW
ncbi:SDR family NAD(P)-dependent oxidoreductase [Catenulispora rubra]|uniref:SDR family NAD(P)-dependent oxidoreductase n=1 Tax=Catenulispora rubra TaxID=280293 RepID=UPI001E400F2E|nr:SDR family oxidoreductase [Catenulispora rubra]